MSQKINEEGTRELHISTPLAITTTSPYHHHHTIHRQHSHPKHDTSTIIIKAGLRSLEHPDHTYLYIIRRFHIDAHASPETNKSAQI